MKKITVILLVLVNLLSIGKAYSWDDSGRPPAFTPTPIDPIVIPTPVPTPILTEPIVFIPTPVPTPIPVEQPSGTVIVTLPPITLDPIPTKCESEKAKVNALKARFTVLKSKYNLLKRVASRDTLRKLELEMRAVDFQLKIAEITLFNCLKQ